MTLVQKLCYIQVSTGDRKWPERHGLGPGSMSLAEESNGKENAMRQRAAASMMLRLSARPALCT